MDTFFPSRPESAQLGRAHRVARHRRVADSAVLNHTQRNAIAPRRLLSDREWDQLIALMKERRIEGLSANGLMTDALAARIAELDHVIALGIGGSRGLSDDGLLQLARMPQLHRLNLSEYPGGKLTDRGLEVLRHLPNLRVLEMTWQKGITDAGVVNLRFCDQLERVDLMGSPTRQFEVSGSPGVTLEGTTVFPTSVAVRYST